MYKKRSGPEKMTTGLRSRQEFQGLHILPVSEVFKVALKLSEQYYNILRVKITKAFKIFSLFNQDTKH